jgi:ribosomal protein S18 acetylase RimI-like enzyme
LTTAKEWSVDEVYAHVWEANDEALEWYQRRGFGVTGEIQDGYYKKLRPTGARVVRIVIN